MTHWCKAEWTSAWRNFLPFWVSKQLIPDNSSSVYGLTDVSILRGSSRKDIISPDRTRSYQSFVTSSGKSLSSFPLWNPGHEFKPYFFYIWPWPCWMYTFYNFPEWVQFEGTQGLPAICDISGKLNGSLYDSSPLLQSRPRMNWWLTFDWISLNLLLMTQQRKQSIKSKEKDNKIIVERGGVFTFAVTSNGKNQIKFSWQDKKTIEREEVVNVETKRGNDCILQQ